MKQIMRMQVDFPKGKGSITSETEKSEEESDNYLAEMAALIDLLHHSPAGGRILVMMDATSPVHSLITFRKIHARRAQEKLAMRMLDTLLQLVARQEVVVFLWQRSHMGSPSNEWADGVAWTGGGGKCSG